MNVPRLSEVIDTAELVFDRDELEDAIEDMADAIRGDYAGDDAPPLFVTVMHGGMPFAAQLAFALFFCCISFFKCPDEEFIPV